MAILKCKMCGGDIQATDNTYGTCDSCGTTMTLPKASDEQIANLYNRANNLRRNNEFDRAIAAYENILNLDSTSAEAHWGLVLSKYGIEYVEDLATRQRIPTCHRVQNDSILTDKDYLSALDNAQDEYTKSLYETEAKIISTIQKDILAISNKEEPYDVFICYKEKSDDGNRTKDSALAQDIYFQLTREGYRVFFARISLENKLGQQYEPYIYNALNSAKVMLVVGTKPEHFNSVWVKNEWSRYLELVKKDHTKLLIPCYRDMDAYDLPEEMAMLQSQDMSRIGFAQDILHGVKKVVNNTVITSSQIPVTVSPQTIAPGIESLIKRGWLFLEDSEWKQADEYFDRVLDINPEYAPAYIGKLCVDLKANSEDKIIETYVNSKRTLIAEGCDDCIPITESGNYKKAIRFADEDTRNRLTNYDFIIREKIQKEIEMVAEKRRREQEELAERRRQEQEKKQQEQERERKRKAQAEEWKRRGLCIYCGGKLEWLSFTTSKRDPQKYRLCKKCKSTNPVN